MIGCLTYGNLIEPRFLSSNPANAARMSVPDQVGPLLAADQEVVLSAGAGGNFPKPTGAKNSTPFVWSP